jgi:GT2 family glycosyltransferase
MSKFSIIIPAHDHYAEKLRSCLESIEACSERGAEIILVLSGPVLSSFKKIPIKYNNCRTIHSKKTLTPSKARNAGARIAKGDWIVFIDSDCIIPKDYFIELRKNILRKTAPDCIIGKILSVDDTCLGCFEEFEHMQSLKKYLYAKDGRTFAKICVGANMAIRKDVFRRIGGFDEKLDSAEDRELGVRLFLNNYNIEYLDGLTVQHKYHISFMMTINRHLWHAKGNKVLYAKYPQIFRRPLINRLYFIANTFTDVLKRNESPYYFAFALAVSIPYIIKFALIRS